MEGRGPSSATIRGNWCFVEVADYSVMVLMAFLTRVCPPRKLKIQNWPGYNARMRIGSCVGVTFPLSQIVLEYFRDMKIHELVVGTWLTSILPFLAIKRAKVLNWGAEGYGSLFHYDYYTGVVHVVASYFPHEQGLTRSKLFVEQVS